MIGRLGKAERLFSRGQKLAKQGRIEAALQHFEAAVALRPRAAGVLLHQALALSESGRLPQAHAAMQQAMSLQPTNPVLPMFRGQMDFDHHDYNMARRWCERALALSPQNPHAIALHALTDMALGDVSRAYQRLTQPLGTMRSTPGAGADSRRPTILQMSNADLQSRLLLVVETDLLQHRSHARTLYQQQAAATHDPEAAEAGQGVWRKLDQFCTRGVMRAKRWWAGLQSLARPTESASRLLRIAAEEAYYLEDFPTARSYYAQLLEQAPEDTDLHHYLFEICYAQGEFRQALHHLRVIVGTNTPLQEMRPWQAACLGELLYQAGQFSGASRYLKQAATRPLQDYKVFYYLGLCRLHDGKGDDARHQFARAVRVLNPGLSRMRLDEMRRVHRELSDRHATHQKTS